MSTAAGDCAIASHIGGRAEQQDCAGAFGRADGRCQLLVVADGMGGREGGARAARTVVEVAGRLWGDGRSADADPPALLDALCRTAHEEIRRMAGEGGSTVAALIATADRAWWAHVGDSRVYALRSGKVVHRSADHSLVQARVRDGTLAADQAATHPDQHKLLRALGGEGDASPAHGQMKRAPDSGFVLCTDGFWSVVGDEEMDAVVREASSAEGCQRWVERAAARGGAGADNLTLAVLGPGARRARLQLRQLWPLYAALGIALGMLLLRVFK